MPQYGGRFFLFYGDTAYRTDAGAQVASNTVFYGDMQAIMSILRDGELLPGIGDSDGSGIRIGESRRCHRIAPAAPPSQQTMLQRQPHPP